MKTMKKTLLVLMAVVMVSPAWGQLLKEKKSPDQRRAEIREDRSLIIKKIAEENPDVSLKIGSAPGYATFSALNVNVLLLATTRGKGVVVDNETGKETFMSVTSIGGGVGAGLKDMQALVIFNDAATMREFVNSGWTFGAQADATAKAGEEGAEFGEFVAVAADEEGAGIDTGLSQGAGEVLQADTAIEVYRITETGIALQATIVGTKFSKIDELNE
jgi:lipid-binding SYLF domain-containing protein